MLRNRSKTADDRSAVLTKAVVRVGEALGLKNQLGKIVGLSPSTVTRMCSGDYLLDEREKSWELAALLVRLYRGLDAIMAGDERSVQAWIHNPNTDLHDTPLNLIHRVSGLSNVVNYVDAHRARV